MKQVKQVKQVFLITAFFSIIGITTYAASGYSMQEQGLRKHLSSAADVEWLVVGAGPAGILTVGLLHDLGISYKDIAWVDPEFNVGRIGKFYQNVPANNATGPFIDFINDCKTFSECTAPSLEKLRTSDPTSFPNLGVIAEPLQDITNYLISQVQAYKGHLEDVHFAQNVWHATIDDVAITSNHVVLATGAEPRQLDYGLDYEQTHTIPLDHALDPNKLAHSVTPQDIVAVFGGAHSAVLLLKFLYELNVKHVLNFYRTPLVYATDTSAHALNSIMGLKGATALWAKTILEGPKPPANIVRIINTPENRKLFLPLCTKVIYAVGYQQSELPLAEAYNNLAYDPTSGIIAPRLFGIGLAFPEQAVIDGTTAYRVGLTSFMEYAQRVIPEWVAGAGDRSLMRRKTLEKFEKLFIVDVL